MVPVLVKQGKTILLTTHYMSEADELSSQVAIINKGKIIARGTPTEIKRSFSKIIVCEAICRQTDAKAIEAVQRLHGIQRVNVMSDGPIQRLTIHALPGTEVKEGVLKTLGEGCVESIVMRDPTLEEAYLSIIK